MVDLNNESELEPVIILDLISVRERISAIWMSKEAEAAYKTWKSDVQSINKKTLL